MPIPYVCLTIGRDSSGRFPIPPLQEIAAFLSDQHAPMFRVRLYQSASPHLTKQRDRKAISVRLVILEEKEPPAFYFNRRKAQFPASSQPPQDLPKKSIFSRLCAHLTRPCGSPAVLGSFWFLRPALREGGEDPVALRPWVSPGVPFRSLQSSLRPLSSKRLARAEPPTYPCAR